MQLLPTEQNKCWENCLRDLFALSVCRWRWWFWYTLQCHHCLEKEIMNKRTKAKNEFVQLLKRYGKKDRAALEFQSCYKVEFKFLNLLPLGAQWNHTARDETPFIHKWKRNYIKFLEMRNNGLKVKGWWICQTA